jgi:hypothetical protein
VLSTHEKAKSANLFWAWWHTPVIPATLVIEVGGLQSEASPGHKHKTLLGKQSKAERTGGVPEVVEYYLSLCFSCFDFFLLFYL